MACRGRLLPPAQGCWLRLIAVVAPIAVVALWTAAACQAGGPEMTMHVKSDAFASGGRIPQTFTEDGKDLSPPLAWDHVPQGTAALALICDDPDAPSREPWVHWVIYNIAGAARSLPEGLPPDAGASQAGGAVQGKNSWGTVGYRGPAPPRKHGPHHYHFRLYALDAPLSLERGASKSELMAAMKGHVLAEGETVGVYER